MPEQVSSAVYVYTEIRLSAFEVRVMLWIQIPHELFYPCENAKIMENEIETENNTSRALCVIVLYIQYIPMKSLWRFIHSFLYYCVDSYTS